MIRALAAVLAVTAQLAPLEPAASGLLFGSWYDRLRGDTPLSTEQRVNYKPFSLWQSDINITQTLQLDYLQNFSAQVNQVNSDAILYLTVYPMEGFANVSQAAVQDLANAVLAITNNGRRVMIRYASEMNGNWFVYGQQPTPFLNSYKNLVNTVRATVSNRAMYAFIWSPNSGNGYPFRASSDIRASTTAADFASMDTNKDGVISILDDPYSPFYPGDEYVDWVGFSIYNYGPQWPWVDNILADANQVEGILLGKNGWGNYNFYNMFSSPQGTAVSKGNKPFMLSETGATIHLWVEPNSPPFNSATPVRPSGTDSANRVYIKQTWWRQFINQTFVSEYPKFRGFMFFEFIKFEETTWRDFTSLGKGVNVNSPFGGDGGDMDGPVLAAFQADIKSDLGSVIIWGNKIQPQPNGSGTSNPSSSYALSTGSIVGIVIGSLTLLALIAF